jgi:hypothetical protein
MAPKSPTKKKKLMSIDELAVAIQKDYRALSQKMDDMVTKADLDKKLWPIQRDIKTLDTNVRELRADLRTNTEIMVSKADLANEFTEEFAQSEHGRQLKDVRRRVEVLEGKLGIKQNHRAA